MMTALSCVQRCLGNQHARDRPKQNKTSLTPIKAFCVTLHIQGPYHECTGTIAYGVVVNASADHGHKTTFKKETGFLDADDTFIITDDHKKMKHQCYIQL